MNSHLFPLASFIPLISDLSHFPWRAISLHLSERCSLFLLGLVIPLQLQKQTALRVVRTWAWMFANALPPTDLTP